MPAYNVRLFHYKGGQQIRIYSGVQDFNAEDYAADFQNAMHRAYVKEKKQEIRGLDDEEIWEHIEKYEAYLEELPEPGVLEEQREKSILNSKSRTIQKIYETARANTWEYFITLTFSPEEVDRYSFEAVTKKLSIWLNNLKKRQAPGLKYLLVPELHADGAFHFHGLISETQGMTFTDSGKRTKDDAVIYNLSDYGLGFTTATCVQDNARVCSYLTKYITKELCTVTKGKKRYWKSRNLEQVQVQEFVMEPCEVDAMLSDISEDITHMKTTVHKFSGLKTTYIEIRDS